MTSKKLLLIAVVAVGFGIVSAPRSEAGLSVGIAIGVPVGCGHGHGPYYSSHSPYYGPPYGYGYGYYQPVRVVVRPHYHWRHGHRYYCRRSHRHW